MLKKTLVVCFVFLILLQMPSIAIGASAEESENRLFADNVGWFYSQDDMEMVGKPTDYLLYEKEEDGFYRFWYRFSAPPSTSLSSYNFFDIKHSANMRSKIYHLMDYSGGISMNGTNGFEVGIQSKYANDTDYNSVFALNEIRYGQRVSFAMDIFADWGFKYFNKCYAVLRCKDLFSDYEIYYLIGWYDLSSCEPYKRLSLYFDIKNNTGYTLQPVGIYFYQKPTEGIRLGGTLGIGNFKYHVFTESEENLLDFSNSLENSLLEVQENEKEESNSQGNASVDALESVIPDKSEGFINGMSSLISAMSYNGTEAKWMFPELYIPEIPGVINKTQLTDSEMEIDFGYWVQQMPSDVLELIRIVLTIALVIYCFKELYGTISYVLTLKKDGGTE